MTKNLKPLFGILLILVIYRMISLDLRSWVPYDLFSTLNFVSDLLAFAVTFFVTRFFVSKSFEKEVPWWITLLISILPALVFIILFRVLLIIVFL